jgi:hypothetical protein
LAGYHPGSVSDQNPAPPADAPIDPLFTHAASPFVRTEAPAPVAFASPPEGPQISLATTWVTYKTQIQFGLAIIAYLMVLVGSVTVVQGNPAAGWKYYMAVLPVVPAAVVIWLTVKALGRLDEVQKRTQMQALGFSMVATGLLTFGYGFLEEAGLPHLNLTFVLPLMAVLWGVGLAALRLRYVFRR